jgi:thiaminase/transcriptional activator TenA
MEGVAAEDLAPEDSLFAHLRAAAGEEWLAYTDHPFIRAVGDGSLPEACFRHYLGQDYLFLIHFTRAYALAAYKGEALADIRHAVAGASTTLREMGFHVEYCAGWGMSKAEMAALPEARETMAYTRYVLERGLSGDLLDLHTALSPCVVGYAEIANRLMADPATRLENNPYRSWIEMYAAADYQDVARAAIAQLDRLAETRAGGAVPTGARMASLVTTFTQATRLEADFWQMGLSAAP